MHSTWKIAGAVIAVLVLAGLLALTVGRGRQGQVPQQIRPYVNSIGMEFVPIPGGSFVMGGDTGDEAPPHKVEIAPFYLGKYEVTQAQWEAVMSYENSAYRHPQRPVERVTWDEAQAFIQHLNGKEGVNLYRLPTEAEWEYAARAGSKSKWFFGDTPALLPHYAWFGQKGDVGTRLVGRGDPNPWGLYDIYGNVWEWVEDCWHDNYLGAPAQGQVWFGGDCSLHILRGGGWNSPAPYARSAVRGSSGADLFDAATGFRIVRIR